MKSLVNFFKILKNSLDDFPISCLDDDMKQSEAIRIANSLSKQLETFFKKESYIIRCGAHWKKNLKETPESVADESIIMNPVLPFVNKLHKGLKIITVPIQLRATRSDFVMPIINVFSLFKKMKEFFGTSCEICNAFVEFDKNFGLVVNSGGYTYHINITM